MGCPTISTGFSNARLHRACAFERLRVGTDQPSQTVGPLASWSCGDIQKAKSAASERYILVPTSVILANHLMMRRRTSYYMLPGIAITKLKYLAQRPGSGRKKEAITSRSVFVIKIHSTSGFCGPNFGIEMHGEKFVLARRLNAYRERTHRRDSHRIDLWRSAAWFSPLTCAYVDRCWKGDLGAHRALLVSHDKTQRFMAAR